jgi:adenosine deaminase
MEVGALPKVELHLHLDCSLSYSLVSRLDPSITRQRFDAEFVAPPRCSSLAEFLTRAPSGFRLMQTRDALRLAVEDLFEQLAADNVIYAELRFAPLLHVERGLSPAEVVEVVERATEACVKTTGIEARAILCTLRHFTREQSALTARLVDDFRGSCVAALDIAGDEAGFPIEPHIDAFRFAIERGLHRTAHAGEAAGSQSVWQTLRELHPSRIGHGVRSIEDPSLVTHLRAQRIHLEVCPSSNVQTRAWPEYGDHPIDRLMREGVPVSVSTDARTITHIDLRREYARIREHFGWTDDTFLLSNLAAIDAAFADESVKSRLRRRLNPGIETTSSPRDDRIGG